MVRKEERRKAAKLNGYVVDSDIINLIADHMKETKNVMSKELIHDTIRVFYSTGLLSQFKYFRRLYMENIGYFKPNQQGRYKCMKLNHTRLKKKILRNRRASQKQLQRKQQQRKQNNLSFE